MDQNEIDLPGGLKFKGGVARQFMPYVGWLVAVSAVVYMSVRAGAKDATPEPETFSAKEMRQLLRAEIAPAVAGIEELAKAQPDKVRIKVLESMAAAKRRYEVN